MDKLVKPPADLIESQEADWWQANREIVDQEIMQAFDEGLMKPFTPPAPATLAIQLDPADAERAQVIAASRGLSYETYVKNLVHEALKTNLAA